LEPFNGDILLARVLSRVSPISDDVIIVTNAERDPKQFTRFSDTRIMVDIFPGSGSLGGIYSGLVASMTQYNLVIGCDMPFLNIDLLHYMIQESAGFDVVVPRYGNLFEPLHAVYSRSCLPQILNMLDQGNLSVHRLYPMVKVRYIETAEIDRFDPGHLSFFNIDTVADLHKARELLK